MKPSANYNKKHEARLRVYIVPYINPEKENWEL